MFAITSTLLKQTSAAFVPRLAAAVSASPLPDLVLRLMVPDLSDPPDNWTEIATSWFTTMLVAGLSVAVVMLAVKWLLRASASTYGEREQRKKTQSRLLLVAGLLPVLAAMAAFWYLEEVYQNVVRLSGLVNGILGAWLVYAFCYGVGHLASPWRRDLF